MNEDLLEPQYKLVNDQYVYCVRDEDRSKPADSISICTDVEDGTLLKHGSNDLVSVWHVGATSKLREAGMADWANNMVVLTGRFPLEEINKCLAVSGYGKTFYAKLMASQLQEVGYTDEDTSAVSQSTPSPS